MVKLGGSDRIEEMLKSLPPSINILDAFNDIVTLKDTNGELVGITNGHNVLINDLAAIVIELAIKSDPTGTNAALQLKLNALQLKLNP
jgi:hypothetical protein